MMGFEHTFWRDPNYRFLRAITLEHVLPPKYRDWVSVVTGTIILVYLGVLAAPVIQEKLATGVLVPGPTSGPLLVETAVLPQADDVAIPDTLSFPHLLPFVGGTEVTLAPNSPRVNALVAFALALWLLMKMLSYYRRSYYFYVEGLLERGKTGAQTPYSTPNYEVCAIYYDVRHGDLLKSFCQSPYGRHIMRRTGIADETMDNYLRARTHIVNWDELESELHAVFTLRDLAHILVEKDPDFYQSIFELGVRERELVGAAEWTERSIKKRRQKDRFWGKVALGQSQSFGADFAYGGAYVLGRYGRDLSQEAIGGGSNFRFVYGNEEIKQLEVILSRTKEANALLVGEEGSGVMDVILDFARDIANGYTNPALKHKRVMAFDAAGFVAGMKGKQELETGLIRLMNDTVRAGNIILILEDLPGFIRSALALDVDVMSLIDPYISGNSIQFIATADNGRFHQYLEPNNSIMQRFEKVMLSEPAEDALVRILEEVAEQAERRNPIFFTYQAVVEIIKSAERYFSDGIMPDKAIDLLVELTPTMLAKGGHLVKKLDVLDFVHQKTNIPVGNISEDERGRLMNLEELMKKLVVGQEQALEVVANAMRRSRAGVRNMEKPIGTFLFLGPTGVGKTETAKALATVFFGNEGAMGRIDMSEFQGEDGLNRMIGSMEGTPGALPVLLKEQPYGVVLLDEFEKTNTKVLDVFLQVFDEGIFHDAQGRKVNGRNTIFIATSNAGAPLIREAMKQGLDLETVKKDIIDQIIAQGKIKPELFNRFDGIVLFRPLSLPEYTTIAELMLKKLQKRLRDKSINLVINDVVIRALLAHGVDPDFGARPMTRAVQEVVEQRVAEKIISGKLLRDWISP
jgi:ATP-dependent Clp protease ATP-binding subunit ClpC